MDAEAVGNVFADVGNPDKPGAPAKKAKQKTPEQKAALEDIFAGETRATLFRLAFLYPLRAIAAPTSSQCSRRVFVVRPSLGIALATALRDYLQEISTQMNLSVISWRTPWV